jgi:hypothetical protein
VAEAFFFSEVQPWAGVYNIQQVASPPSPLQLPLPLPLPLTAFPALQPFDVFGYSPNRWVMDICIACSIGTVYRMLALPVLLWHSRSASATFCGTKNKS